MEESEIHCLKIYLKCGLIFEGLYPSDEYEFIYKAWEQGTKMAFQNGEVLGSEVVAIQWE